MSQEQPIPNNSRVTPNKVKIISRYYIIGHYHSNNHHRWKMLIVLDYPIMLVGGCGLNDITSVQDQ